MYQLRYILRYDIKYSVCVPWKTELPRNYETVYILLHLIYLHLIDYISCGHYCHSISQLPTNYNVNINKVQYFYIHLERLIEHKFKTSLNLDRVHSTSCVQFSISKQSTQYGLCTVIFIQAGVTVHGSVLCIQTECTVQAVYCTQQLDSVNCTRFLQYSLSRQSTQYEQGTRGRMMRTLRKWTRSKKGSFRLHILLFLRQNY